MNDGDDPLGDIDEPFAEDRQHRPGEVPEAKSPDVEVPKAEVPTPEAPSTEVPSTDPDRLTARYNDADPQFKALFWKLVVLYKFGLMGLAFGLLLLAFGADSTWGTTLAVGGGGLLVYALYLTRRGQRRLDAGEFDHDTDDDGFEHDIDGNGFDHDIDGNGFDHDIDGDDQLPREETNS